jgi:hypothetical protein
MTAERDRHRAALGGEIEMNGTARRRFLLEEDHAGVGPRIANQSASIVGRDLDESRNPLACGHGGLPARQGVIRPLWSKSRRGSDGKVRHAGH